MVARIFSRMNIGIIGAGRAGQGLGLALHQAGHDIHLHGRRQQTVLEPLAPLYTWGECPPWLGEVEVVILAVRDRQVAETATDVARCGGVSERHVVLHVSGILDEAPLDSLKGTGCHLGTFHPLQAIARAEWAPERLRGALAAITGDRRAAEVGMAIAERIGMVPVVIEPTVKAKYHAAAVIASNFTVVLAAVAEQMFLECGFDEATARQGLGRLMEGTLENVRAIGPQAALTGPVVRGDEETLSKHRAVLPEKWRAVYRALGAVAREIGIMPP